MAANEKEALMKRLILIVAALALVASCAPTHGYWGHGRGGWNCAAPSWNSAPDTSGQNWQGYRP